MSDNKRIGRQFPTQSVVLEYSDTKGGEAILLYEQSTRRLITKCVCLRNGSQYQPSELAL